MVALVFFTLFLTKIVVSEQVIKDFILDLLCDTRVS